MKRHIRIFRHLFTKKHKDRKPKELSKDALEEKNKKRPKWVYDDKKESEDEQE